MTQDVAAARVDLERLAKLADEATPGPWAVREGTYAVHQPEYECWIPAGPDDAAFIAVANPATIKALLARVAALEEENADLKESVVAFAAPHAVIYARDFGLPEGHLNSRHYDLLERCGARMVDFTRSDQSSGNPGQLNDDPRANPQDERGRE